jgi:WD40 repeat protein/serine/threonine protein kinase
LKGYLEMSLKGQTIRGYLIEELIGHGGFGTVYRASQPLVKREVAIKVIAPQYVKNPDFIRRFEVEAQLVARLESIHIVPLYDYWRDPEGAYLVMRWLRGGNLFQSLRKSTWTLEETALLLEQIGAALNVAHRNGVIHRDIKPANILLDEERNAFLADFGIAAEAVEENGGKPDQIVGSPPYMSPEQILREPLSPQSDIYSLGIVLFEMLTGTLPYDADTDYKVLNKHLNEPMPSVQERSAGLPNELNAVIWKATAKHPLARYQDGIAFAAEFKQIVQRLQGVGVSSPQYSVIAYDTERASAPQTAVFTESSELRNPYKGLQPFLESDAGDFFGRETLITTLGKRLQHERFIAVVGASGSGKSSVVRAGLIPLILRGLLPHSENWFVVNFNPGAQPFDELRMGLLKVAFEAPPDLETILKHDETGLAQAVDLILTDRSLELVIVIDQFEEIFTLAPDNAERSLLLRSLAYAITSPDSRVRLVITLRADFYNQPLIVPQFGDLLLKATEVIQPMTPVELERAILGPAERAGLTLELGLITAMIADVSHQPGALPLLQFAITELFERRQGRKLVLQAYEESGGVMGALARRADELYGELSEAQQTAAHQMFLRLINIGEGPQQDTRRRVLWSELTSIAQDEAALLYVLDKFDKARLLTFDHDAVTREPTVEIAHESLISQWKQLNLWLNTNREDLQTQRRLASALQDWQEGKRDPSFLASGVRLDAFADMLRRQTIVLNEQERLYIEQSLAQRQKQINRVRLVIASLVIFSLVTLLLAVFAFDRQTRAVAASATSEAERARADLQARIATSRQFAVTALTNLGTPDLALLLSVEAVEVMDTFEARSSLLTVLSSQPHLRRYLYRNEAGITSTAYSPQGDVVAFAARDGLIGFMNVTTGEVALHNAHEGRAWNVAFSTDGALLASVGEDSQVILWDTAREEILHQWTTGQDNGTWSVAFTPGGSRVAVGGGDGTIQLYDTADQNPIGDALMAHGDIVYTVAFNNTGTVFASGGADNLVRLWRVGDEGLSEFDEALDGHSNWVLTLAFSPDDALLATGGADNTVRLWDGQTGEPFGFALEGHTDWVRSVAFNADGSLLVSASADRSIRLWDVASGFETREPMLGHQNAVWDTAFAGDDQTLLSAGADGLMLEWSMQSAPTLSTMLPSHQDAVLTLDFNDNGSLLAVAGGSASADSDNTIQILDAETYQERYDLLGHAGPVTSLAFSGDLLASASTDSTIVLWDMNTGEPTGAALSGETSEAIYALVFAGDVLVSGGDGGVRLWNIATRDSTSLTDQPVLSLALNADQNLLAGGTLDGHVMLWTLGDAITEPRLIVASTQEILTLGFSPDGNRLAVGSRDGTVTFWDVDMLQALGQPLVGHEDGVLSLAFSPDGQLLATGSRDNTVILWDTTAGRILGQPLRASNDWVNAVSFRPDGATLAAGTMDQQVFLWNTRLEIWRETACLIANRTFTDYERQLYLTGQTYEVNACGR